MRSLAAVPLVVACVLAAAPAVAQQNIDLLITPTGTLPSVVEVGTSITVRYIVVANGSGPVPTFDVELLASIATPVVDNGPAPLATDTVSGLMGGGSHTGTLAFVVPDIPGIPSGATIYTALFADRDRVVSETDVLNNIFEFGAVTLVRGENMGDVSIETSRLPEGRVGEPYQSTLRASGAPSPMWSIAAGALPVGLSLSSAGEIRGTPVSVGEFPVAILAEQLGFRSDTANFLMVVRQALSGPLEIDSSALPNGAVGQLYAYVFAARGGMPPYRWAFEGGALPPGLSLVANGSLAGTPTAVGSFNFVVRVTDSEGDGASAGVSLTIGEVGTEPTTLRITSPDRLVVTFQAPASLSLTAEGGAPPYMWAVQGNLPAGLALSGDRITGSATSSAAANVVLAVLDSAGAAATKPVTVQALASTGGGGNGGNTGNTGSGSGRRRSGGCVCSPDSQATPGQLTGLALLLGAVLVRRRRRTAR